MPKKMLSAVVAIAKGAYTGCLCSQELDSCSLMLSGKLDVSYMFKWKMRMLLNNSMFLLELCNLTNNTAVISICPDQ